MAAIATLAVGFAWRLPEAMKSKWALNVWFMLLLLHPGSTLGAGLRTDGTRFVDEQGATVLLRGWNMSAKIPPYDHHATEASLGRQRRP
jgi:hypothetical protein